MLSSLGYIVGGSEAVIRAALRSANDVTLMMPSFPFTGTTEAYLANDPLFDRETTPSQSGLLSETLRRYPGVERSYHPTHPCVAIGPAADFLINGSEVSPTPFGDDTTYGRFSRLEDALLLLIHTNNTSFVHRIQEMVNMPNLFLSEHSQVKGRGPTGQLVQYSVYVHRPTLPLYVVEEDEIIEYIWLPDYVLLFPDYNRERILGRLKSERTKEFLVQRHRYFLEKGIYRNVFLRNAEIMIVRIKPWMERICRDLKQNIVKHAERYRIDTMQAAHDAGMLTKF
jgi:aminoglycoside N3'-acetyltransferase